MGMGGSGSGNGGIGIDTRGADAYNGSSFKYHRALDLASLRLQPLPAADVIKNTLNAGASVGVGGMFLRCRNATG